ncbi:MAG: DUF7224 domain-containing protein [Mycobacteriaceae bacterium]
MGRLRSGGVLVHPIVRNKLRVTVAACLPTVILSLVILMVIGMISAGVSFPPVSIAWMTVLVVCAQASVGAALGARVNRVIAVPATLIGGYIWLAFPPSIEPFWIRHVTGSWGVGCCSLDTVISSKVVLSLSIFNIGVIAAAVLLSSSRHLLLRSVLTLVVALCATSVASAISKDVGPEPVQPRSGSLVCDEGAIRICVWPENKPILRKASASASTAASLWGAAGVALPTQLSEKADGATGLAPFGVSTEMDSDEIVDSLAYALLPAGADCTAQGYGASGVQPYLHFWLVRTAGVQPPPGNVMPNVEDIVELVLAVSKERQLAWYLRLTESLKSCNIPSTEILQV